MVANTGTFSRLSASPSANEWVQDNTDSIHSGIAKALVLMGQGSYLASGCTTTENAGSPAYLSIGNGGIFRNNEYISITGATASTSASSNADYPASHASITYYCLLVLADGSQGGETENRLYLRGSASLVSSASSPVVAEPLGGDVIIAMIEIAAATATSTVGRKIQWLGINTLSNNLSIGYNSSGYTETMSIKASSGDTIFKNTVSDKDIIFNVNDGSVDTEVMRIKGSNACVGIGTNSPTEMLHLADADGSEPTILIENTGTAGNEPEIVFWRSTGTGADSRDIGHIRFKADDTAGNLHTFAQIYVDQMDADTTTEDGRMIFDVTQAGTDGVEHLRISGGNVVINETGADIDFRVEGDSLTHLLFTDAGNDRVGINQSNPVHLLDIDGDLACKGFRVNTSNTTAANNPPSSVVLAWTMDKNDNIIILTNSTPAAPDPTNVASFAGTLPTITSDDVGRIYEFNIVAATAASAVGLTMPSGVQLTNNVHATLAAGGATYSITAATYLRIFVHSTSEYRILNA